MYEEHICIYFILAINVVIISLTMHDTHGYQKTESKVQAQKSEASLNHSQWST